MQAPLRILHLEDDARDAELLLAMLEAAGIVSQVTRVDSQADFLASLEQGGCDLILADYSLPSFDGISALKIALEKCPDVPFIFVSGTLGEEVAVEALKIGAADYVLKERLSRLALSVQRALREAQARAGHKRAEGALRESEERFRALVTASSDALYRMSADWSEMINLRGMDFISDTLQPNRNWLAEYIPQDEQPRVTAAIKEAIRAKGVFELEHRVFLADGTIGWTSSRAVPMLDDVGEITEWFGAADDITERRRAEEALRESERRYRYIFQAAGVSIWEEDFSQIKAAIDELKAQGVRDFRQYLAEHPEFIWRVIQMVKIIDVNDATVKLFAAESKDELLVSLDKIFLPETEGVFAGELIALAEGRTSFESETILQTLKGDKLTVLFTLTFPPQPANLDSVLVTITDITERKRAEEALQKAQAELAHVTRVTTMGELASSIAHEVNQPLAAIVTNGNAALRWLAADPPNLDEVRESVGRIVRDGHRASEVVGHVRALFRKAATAKERLDINGLIQDVLALVPGELRRNRVQLRTELAYDLPQVVADRVQLQQVLLNLIINAVEAMSVITEHPRQLLIRSQRADADGVLVSVEDSGVGIGAQNPAQIFDAFFTTKPEGLGMGLSISRTTIEAHGGRLWATANEGYGATFQFTLPMNGGNA